MTKNNKRYQKIFMIVCLMLCQSWSEKCCCSPEMDSMDSKKQWIEGMGGLGAAATATALLYKLRRKFAKKKNFRQQENPVSFKMFLIPKDIEKKINEEEIEKVISKLKSANYSIDQRNILSLQLPEKLIPQLKTLSLETLRAYRKKMFDIKSELEAKAFINELEEAAKRVIR